MFSKFIALLSPVNYYADLDLHLLVTASHTHWCTTVKVERSLVFWDLRFDIYADRVAKPGNHDARLGSIDTID